MIEDEHESAKKVASYIGTWAGTSAGGRAL